MGKFRREATVHFILENKWRCMLIIDGVSKTLVAKQQL